MGCELKTRAHQIESIRLIHTSAEGNSGQGLEVDDSGTVHVVGGEFLGNEEGLEIDDAQSVRIVNGLFAENEDEGLDIDNVGDISVINVVSRDNGGSGLQIESDDDEILITSVRIVTSQFDNNGDDGVQIVVDDPGEIAKLLLIGNASTNNANQAFNIDPQVGNVKAHANRASGNSDDTLPS